MKIQVVTTITTLIDIDTFDPEHSVEIDCDTELPHNAIYAVVIGGCKSAIATLEKKV